MVVTLCRALNQRTAPALYKHPEKMATSGNGSRIEGSMCVLVKDCIVRSTKAGDLVVVIEHIRPGDDVVETMTLLIFQKLNLAQGLMQFKQ